MKRFQPCVTREHRDNYDTSRDVLLEAMGYSKEEAIHSFLFPKRHTSWSVGDTYQRATFLVKQMLKDMDDVAQYLAKEWTIACHNMKCGSFIRTRNPITPIQLLAALNEYERMYGCAARKSFRRGQNFHNDNHQTDNGLSIQHQEKRESNQGVKKEKAITCYSCGTRGHKSTACPNVDTSVNNNKFTGSQREDKRHLRRLCSTSSKLSNEVNGKIGPDLVSCNLDSGAQISVVHEELVRPEQMREDMTTVSGFGS